MSDLVERRETAPHTAVLFLRYEVHEKLPSGELRGSPVERGSKIFKVEGADRFICVRRLNELLKELGDASSDAPGEGQ